MLPKLLDPPMRTYLTILEKTLRPSISAGASLMPSPMNPTACLRDCIRLCVGQPGGTGVLPRIDVRRVHTRASHHDWQDANRRRLGLVGGQHAGDTGARPYFTQLCSTVALCAVAHILKSLRDAFTALMFVGPCAITPHPPGGVPCSQ